MPHENYKIMVVAGEASGDAHAAKLVRALRKTAPAAEWEFYGATSHHLRQAGVETIVNADDFSVVGLLEIAKVLPRFWQDFQQLKNTAVERKTDAAILVDFPDFNLKLARALKKRGLKIIYYISPQLWAWRKHRVEIIRKYVDLVLTILPFEKDWYAGQGVEHVEYVGNPTVREVHADREKKEFCQIYGLDENKPIIALLAGSRQKEIARILPPLLETAALMAKKNTEIQFVVALASVRKIEEAEKAVTHAKQNGMRLPPTLLIVQNETYNALRSADAAAVTSGTATLETALLGTPMAIVYKTSQVNYKLLRPLISVEHFGLINLIAGYRVAAELIQDEFTPGALAAELFRLLEPENNQAMRFKLKEIADTLGHGGASLKAAEAVLRELQRQ